MPLSQFVLMDSYVSSVSVRLRAVKRSKLIDGSGNDHPLPHLLEHFLSSLAPFGGCALVELTQQGVFIHPLDCELPRVDIYGRSHLFFFYYIYIELRTMSIGSDPSSGTRVRLGLC